MCGRFFNAASAQEIANEFEVDEVRESSGEAKSSYNIAPTDPVLAVAEREGSRRLGSFRWGLVPSWSKDPTGGARLINARVEGISDKPAFRVALEKRRCLIPAQGFYEWRRTEEGKQPYSIRRPDGGLMAFAGLWEAWRDPGDPAGQWVRTCAIVTTEAIGSMNELHNRMPVMMPRSIWDAWLDAEMNDKDQAAELLRLPFPEELEIRPASRAVNSVKNDGPQLLQPDPDVPPVG